ncbi:MAG: hypothetical protein ACREML_05935 [Vulcanimicrobiaceae bacterium]
MIRSSFRVLLRQAIRHFAAAGYSSESDLQTWIARLHEALDAEIGTDEGAHRLVAGVLEAVYEKDVSKRAVLRRIPGVLRYTLENVKPELRAELDRRIFAAADLIKINRRKRKAQTLQRFAGWVSSVPRAGSQAQHLRTVASQIAAPAQQAKWEARRLAVDQGHKLSAAVAHVVAQGNGAIAAIWHDRGEKDRSYHARPHHLARSGTLFLIRDSWAINQGLIRRGSRPYLDEIEQPAELPFCSCTAEYIVTPRELPQECVTARGRRWIAGG